jgi:hypothetical protein
VKTQLLSFSLGDPIPLGAASDDILETGEEPSRRCWIERTPAYRDEDVTRHAASGVRPVDCDLSSFLYMSIGESEGWPVSFIEVPGHNFVRWRFADGAYLNWDTVDAAVRTDDQYRQGTHNNAPFDSEAEKHGGYLLDRSPDEIDAYYLSLFVGRIKAAACVQSAYTRTLGMPNLPAVVYNDVAWHFATDPAFKRTDYARTAVQLSNEAVAKDPQCSYRDTLSCTYAAAGEFDRAVEIERAISSSSRRIKDFLDKRDCYDATVAADGACGSPEHGLTDGD